MGRYYFHSVTADGLLMDEIGVEVDDLNLKLFLREAYKAVFELATEFGANDEEMIGLSFRVVDDVGQTVLELPMGAMAHPSHLMS